MIDYPKKLDIIFDKLDKNSAKPIIIGGYIRDYLLNIDSDDIDIEVYGISSFEKLENILKEFGDINSVGKSFGVCKVRYENLFLDFTLPRTDSKISTGHSGFDIKIEKNLDFITASKRRDFTINTIAYDVKNKIILDPFNGIADLKKKVLKMVDSSTFIEDPLRILRAVQFCARFDLEMDRELYLVSKSMIEQNMLSQLPKERIYGEIRKLLLKSKNPSIGFELINKLKILKYFLQCKKSMLYLDNMAKLEITNTKTKEVLMLAVLCYRLDTKDIEKLIINLTNDKKLLARILTLVKNIDNEQKNLSDYELYKLAILVNIQELCYLYKAIFDDGGNILKRAKQLNILNKKMPAILKGEDIIKLGVKPSPKFTNILSDAYDAQIHRKFTTHKEGIAWLKNRLSL